MKSNGKALQRGSMIGFAFWKKAVTPAFTRSPKTVGWQAGGAEGVVKMLGGLENFGVRRGKKEAMKRMTGQEKRLDGVSPSSDVRTVLGSPASCSINYSRL